MSIEGLSILLNLLDASEVPDCDCEVAAEKGSDQFQSGSKLFVIMVVPSPSFDAIVSRPSCYGRSWRELSMRIFTVNGMRKVVR